MIRSAGIGPSKHLQLLSVDNNKIKCSFAIADLNPARIRLISLMPSPNPAKNTKAERYISYAKDASTTLYCVTSVLRITMGTIG